MRTTRGRVVEIASVADLDRRLAAGAGRLTGWHLHGLDLRDRTTALAAVDVAGAMFLDCDLGPGQKALLRRRGAVVRREVTAVPAEARDHTLYAPRDLYDAPSYADSFDARMHAWSRAPRDRANSLARALHDHEMDDALTAWVRDRRLVGVMGGHALERGSAEYAAAARLGRTLGASCVVATGGGPGAMEAANLGAFTSRSAPAVLDAALDRLSRVPSYRPDLDAWLDAAHETVARVDEPAESLGIPTWHYGHEPTNTFATTLAKYFRNATREATLLEVCDAGIVFLPGAAGTVQEVFQDACENYYADESSLAPMVLVGREHWTQTLPAWPLLRTLARGRPMEPHVHLVDTLEEAAAIVAL